jgi:hypothetical protein
VREREMYAAAYQRSPTAPSIYVIYIYIYIYIYTERERRREKEREREREREREKESVCMPPRRNTVTSV